MIEKELNQYCRNCGNKKLVTDKKKLELLTPNTLAVITEECEYCTDDIRHEIDLGIGLEGNEAINYWKWRRKEIDISIMDISELEKNNVNIEEERKRVTEAMKNEKEKNKELIRDMKGLFKENGGYAGFDDQGGELWIEYFGTRNGAIEWLFRLNKPSFERDF